MLCKHPCGGLRRGVTVFAEGYEGGGEAHALLGQCRCHQRHQVNRSSRKKRRCEIFLTLTDNLLHTVGDGFTIIAEFGLFVSAFQLFKYFLALVFVQEGSFYRGGKIKASF